MKKAGGSKYPLVLVEWEDASELDGSPWVSLSSAEQETKPHIVYQVGYLLSQTPTRVVLTHAVMEDTDTVARREQIPAGMVRNITFLKPKANAQTKLRE